jgi:hypothetical protein
MLPQNRREIPPRLQDILAAILLFILPTLFFYRYLFVNPAPLIMPTSTLGSDLPREVWPVARIVELALLQTSAVPLWRNYHLAGTPLIGHPIAPISYPLFWLTQILPIPLGLNLLAVVHLWLSGLGTYFFLRLEHHARVQVALIGAVVFSTSPRWIALLSGGHWNSIYSIAWWSWAVLVFFRYWKTGKFKWAILLGIAIACQCLTDLKYTLYSLFFFSAVTLFLI